MYGSQEQGSGMMDMLMQAMMSQPQSGYGQAGPAQMDEMGMAAQGMGGGQPSPTIGVSKMTEAGRLPRGYPGQAQQQQGGNENPFGDLMSNWNDTMATAGYGEDYGEDNGGSYLSEDQAQTGNQIWNIFSALYGGGSGGGGGG